MASGGKYELLHDHFRVYEDEKNPATSAFHDYKKGDPVQLTEEQVERLTVGPRPAFGKPGEAARREAQALQAQADAARARAEEAEQRAADAESEAKAAAKVPAAK